MKRLILMRHAKSSWEDDVTDFDRPLNRRGLRDAPRVAAELAQRGWVPEVVVHSAAVRTTQTWQCMAQRLPAPTEVRSSKSLYLGGTADIRAAAESLPDGVTTALLIGHNPGWELAVSQLSRENVRLTTANAALFEIDLPAWRKALSTAEAWKLVEIIRPKELPDRV